jgi:hypothetical protein
MNTYCSSGTHSVLSIFRVMCKTITLGRMMPHFDLMIEENAARTPRDGSGRVHGHVPEDELLKLYKNGQFPD